MEIEKFIDKEEIEIDGRKFAISKIPAVQAQEIYGEIVRETDDIGDIGMTFLSLSVAVKLLSYSAYEDGGVWFTMGSENDINDGCPEVMTLIKLEAAMIRKNFGFLFNGSLQKVLEDLRGKKQATSGQA